MATEFEDCNISGDEDLLELPTPVEKDATTSRRKRTKPGKPRKTQFRYNANRDLILVAEVENLKPFLEIGKPATIAWKAVASTISEKFSAEITHQGAKFRFELLLARFEKEDFLSTYKSGTEEEITDIKNKLADISSLIKSHECQKRQEEDVKSEKAIKEKEVADEIRDAALTTMRQKRKSLDSSDSAAQPQKRMTDKSLVDLWQSKQEADREMQLEKIKMQEKASMEELQFRKDELSFKREQLDLDRRKLELEQDKTKQELEFQRERLKLEKEERSAQIKNQELMLQLLLKK